MNDPLPGTVQFVDPKPMTVTDRLRLLRKEFPKSAVGKLPKPKSKDAQKGHCDECGGYHGLPAVHLDYVGHAAVTALLLEVDPLWSWEPMGLTPEGMPAMDRAGGLWINLTICGVTRPGYGDGASPKECIGDAIRNAAMRFGVALELWSKEDLYEIKGVADESEPKRADAHQADPKQEEAPKEPDQAEDPEVTRAKAAVAEFAKIDKKFAARLWTAVVALKFNWLDLGELFSGATAGVRHFSDTLGADRTDAWLCEMMEMRGWPNCNDVQAVEIARAMADAKKTKAGAA